MRIEGQSLKMEAFGEIAAFSILSKPQDFINREPLTNYPVDTFANSHGTSPPLQIVKHDTCIERTLENMQEGITSSNVRI